MTEIAPYMVTDSLGSMSYGEPRSTNDIDIVIDPTREQLLQLIRRLEVSAYVSENAALDALARRSMFNAIANDSGEKVDLILRKKTPYYQMEFDRRELRDFGVVTAYAVAAEDSILSKLVWAKTGESERQRRDVYGVLRVMSEELDWEYLQHWAEELGVTGILAGLVQELEDDLSQS